MVYIQVIRAGQDAECSSFTASELLLLLLHWAELWSGLTVHLLVMINMFLSSPQTQANMTETWPGGIKVDVLFCVCIIYWHTCSVLNGCVINPKAKEIHLWLKIHLEIIKVFKLIRVCSETSEHLFSFTRCLILCGLMWLASYISPPLWTVWCSKRALVCLFMACLGQRCQTHFSSGATNLVIWSPVGRTIAW